MKMPDGTLCRNRCVLATMALIGAAVNMMIGAGACAGVPEPYGMSGAGGGGHGTVMTEQLTPRDELGGRMAYPDNGFTRQPMTGPGAGNSGSLVAMPDDQSGGPGVAAPAAPARPAAPAPAAATGAGFGGGAWLVITCTGLGNVTLAGCPGERPTA